MDKPIIYYCYDAYCGWCYGFSEVMKKIEATFNDRFEFEVLSGGMIPAENPSPIKATASYISKEYKNVEAISGIQFGKIISGIFFIPKKVIGIHILKKQP
jgi:putative protein-disulfide isomerase